MSEAGRPVRAGLVLACTAGFVLLAGAVGLLATQSTRAVDPQATLAQWFEVGELPAGLEPVEAQVLARGDVVVRLEHELLHCPDPDCDSSGDCEHFAPAREGRSVTSPDPYGEEAPRNEPEEGKESEPFDWSTVPMGAAGSAPREVIVAEIPLEHARAELQQLFEFGQDLAGDWKSVPRSGGKRVLERGRLDWGELAAPFVLEREFENGGTFRDTLRVNLSSATTARILVARWSRGFPASRAPVQVLIAALRPR